jgi:hypothetical protein
MTVWRPLSWGGHCGSVLPGVSEPLSVAGVASGSSSRTGGLPGRYRRSFRPGEMICGGIRCGMTCELGVFSIEVSDADEAGAFYAPLFGRSSRTRPRIRARGRDLYVVGRDTGWRRARARTSSAGSTTSMPRWRACASWRGYVASHESSDDAYTIARFGRFGLCKDGPGLELRSARASWVAGSRMAV